MEGMEGIIGLGVFMFAISFWTMILIGF